MMRWDPKIQYKELLLLARNVLREECCDAVSLRTGKQLANGVLDLVSQIEKDEMAVSATLKECGGHLTLSSLVLYYKNYEKELNKEKVARAAAEAKIELMQEEVE